MESLWNHLFASIITIPVVTTWFDYHRPPLHLNSEWCFCSLLFTSYATTHTVIGGSPDTRQHEIYLLQRPFPSPRGSQVPFLHERMERILGWHRRALRRGVPNTYSLPISCRESFLNDRFVCVRWAKTDVCFRDPATHVLSVFWGRGGRTVPSRHHLPAMLKRTPLLLCCVTFMQEHDV